MKKIIIMFGFVIFLNWCSQQKSIWGTDFSWNLDTWSIIQSWNLIQDKSVDEVFKVIDYLLK